MPETLHFQMRFARFFAQFRSTCPWEKCRMISPTKKKHNYVDALATAMRYAVLTKESRIQILIRPTAKQLRKRGKRGWQLFATMGKDRNAQQVLEETVKQALHELETKNRNGKDRT